MQSTSKIIEINFDKATGLWWPSDTDPRAGYDYMIRRVTDIDVAMGFCRKAAVAVQAGGNIGMWPRRLHKFFETIHTFEPVPHIYGALVHNTRHLPGVIAHNKLLTNHGVNSVPFSVHSGGVSRVDMQATSMLGYEHLATIDSLELPCCDAIFLDVEGHEMDALRGATETIERYRPVITLEIWDDNLKQYRDYMAELGYVFKRRVHGDYIFSPAEF